MKPDAIRVLIVEDSVVVRQMVSDALGSDPDIQVVGAVPNGKVALEKLAELKPDLLTLDIEMPEMGGLEMLAELGRRGQRLPVIMFSTVTERGARATLDALARGASDYVCKPSGQRSIAATLERIRSELIPKIHGLKRKRTPAALSGAPSRPVANASASLPAGASWPTAAARVQAVVIAVSTGGPSALADLIPALPRELPVPILIVQHMPPVFTQVLAERLAGVSQVKVREARPRARIEPGVVYIAPGDYHMRVAGSAREAWLIMDQGPAENGCRPSADPLFQSAAATYGDALLALVLTGVGHDGTKGAEAVRRAGGTVWAQDEATSIAWGMPSSVVDAKLAQRVLPLAHISRGIVAAASGGKSVSILPRRGA
jgi:two-component system chemotaxis response regulator CheB